MLFYMRGCLFWQIPDNLKTSVCKCLAEPAKGERGLSFRREGLEIWHIWRWLACPYALSVTCLPPSMRWHMPTLAPALLLSIGTKVGIWASWANLFLFWAFVIGAERSLFLMLNIQTEECFRPGQGQPPSPCVHPEQRKLVCGGKREDTSAAPEGKYTQLGSRLPHSWFPASCTSCPQGPWDVPASQQ